MTVYFDNNATTPVDDRVVAAMLPYMGECFGNPSAIYHLGRSARTAVDEAREQVAALVGAHPTQVVFTSGGTEANNLALKGTVGGLGVQRIAYGAIEHSSVRNVVKALARRRVTVNEIRAVRSGNIERQEVRDVFHRHRPQLVSVMWVNNETGVIFDLPWIAEYCRNNDAILHTDAVQAAGKIPLDFANSGVHLMSLSSHKLYGPKGVGALIVDKALDIEPLFHGGGQEAGRRSGTESVAAIVGFGKAAELSLAEFAANANHTRRLRGILEEQIKFIEGVEVFGGDVVRVANTSFIGIRDIDAETLIMRLDEHDIALSSGSACSSKSGKPSAILLAMGVDEALARGAIRVSFSHYNTSDEVERFVGILGQLIGQLRSSSK